MEALWMGAVTGLGLAISTGPVFLTLIQLAVARGFTRALLFIAGVAVADWCMIFTLWFGLNKLDMGVEESLLKLVGGVALLVFGITFLVPPKTVQASGQPQDTSNKKKRREDSGLFMKGVVMAGLNPIVWAFWGGVSQFSISKFDVSSLQLTYFVGILVTVLITDVGKAFYAQKLKPFFSSRRLHYFNIVIGVLLLILGGQFVVRYLLS